MIKNTHFGVFDELGVILLHKNLVIEENEPYSLRMKINSGATCLVVFFQLEGFFKMYLLWPFQSFVVEGLM